MRAVLTPKRCRGRRRGFFGRVFFKMKSASLCARLSVLSAALCGVFSAYGQTASSGALKEVVVTASRSEQLLNAAPVGTTVITSEAILDAGVSDANEAIRLLGGVLGRRDLNGGREATLDLRGYGDAASSNMVVLVNGMRISENEMSSAPLSAIAPEMIERIEIVRGGSSVLWGAGASAGVINVITKDSGTGNHPSGSIVVGLESFDTRDVRANVYGGSEALKFFAQARNYTSAGYRDNGANDETTVNAGVSFGSQNTLKVQITAFSDTANVRWPGALPVAQFEANPRATNTPNNNAQLLRDRLTLNLERKLTVGLLSVDVSHMTKDMTAFQDYGASLTDTNHPHSDSYQISPKLNLKTEWDSAVLDTVVGVDASDWSYRRHEVYVDPTYGFDAQEKGQQTSQAGYIRSNLTLDSGWRIDAGWRSEQFDTSLETVGGGSPLVSKPLLDATELGLGKSFNDHWSAFVRTASSYRVANIDEMRSLTTPLLPQQAHDLELGLRYADQAASFGLRVFNQHTRNEIQYNNNLMLNTNLDPVHREGIELDGLFKASDSTRFSASLQSINAVISEGIYAGKRVPLAAESNVVFKATHNFDAHNSVDIVSRMVGKAPMGNDWDNKCSRDIPAAEFWDFAYRYGARKETGWSLLFAIDNLLDRQTYSVGYTNGSCSGYNVYPDDGRRVRVRASYDFK